MREMLLLVTFCWLLLGCRSSIPITFHGKSFSEYIDKPNSSSYYSYPAAIQQRWRLVSINDDYAPLNINLIDHNFSIYFRTTRVSKGRYAFGGKITQGFWGEYTFDDKRYGRGELQQRRQQFRNVV